MEPKKGQETNIDDLVGKFPLFSEIRDKKQQIGNEAIETSCKRQ